MKKYTDNLKRQAEENPLAAVGVGALAITAITKLMQANTAHRNSKTWKQEVQRRAMKTR